MSTRERLIRLLEPVAATDEPNAVLAQRRTVDYAFGNDGRLRRDVVPRSVLPYPMTWIDTGAVAVQINLPVIPVPGAMILDSVHAHIFTPPTGQTMNLEIETGENDTVYQWSIGIGENYAVVAGLGIEIEAGTWLRMAVNQIGSGTGGSNLSVTALLYPV